MDLFLFISLLTHLGLSNCYLYDLGRIYLTLHQTTWILWDYLNTNIDIKLKLNLRAYPWCCHQKVFHFSRFQKGFLFSSKLPVLTMVQSSFFPPWGIYFNDQSLPSKSEQGHKFCGLIEHTMLHHLWIKSSRVRARLSLYLLKPSNWPSLDWLSALFWRALSFQDCEGPTSLPRKVWKLLDKETAILNVSPSFPSDWGLSSAWFRLRTFFFFF